MLRGQLRNARAFTIVIFASSLLGRFGAAQIPVFRDIASSAGVSNDDLGLGAAFIDVNNDGLDDIHLINDSQPGDQDYLFLNQGNRSEISTIL